MNWTFWSTLPPQNYATVTVSDVYNKLERLSLYPLLVCFVWAIVRDNLTDENKIKLISQSTDSVHVRDCSHSNWFSSSVLFYSIFSLDEIDK